MKTTSPGPEKAPAFFEGWYLKHQTRDGRALALIPAVHTDRRGRRTASLQVITADRTWWLPSSMPEYACSGSRFHIRMGGSTFDSHRVQLQVEREDISLHGTLHYGPFTPLKSHIMGPFRFVPGMECSHGVLSMGHALVGTLELNGEKMDFSGGLGYGETDRGRSFPRSYLWTQCTWQEPQLGSLMLAIAHIPWGGSHFTGCICAVIHRGREYRLATYRGARVEGWSAAGALIRQGRFRLAVEVLGGRGHPLRAPVNGAMSRTIQERLCARVRCRFWQGEQLLFDRIDCCAGFEYVN